MPKRKDLVHNDIDDLFWKISAPIAQFWSGQMACLIFLMQYSQCALIYFSFDF